MKFINFKVAHEKALSEGNMNALKEGIKHHTKSGGDAFLMKIAPFSRPMNPVTRGFKFFIWKNLNSALFPKIFCHISVFIC